MGLPKAELHIHLEGTMEPETVLELAEKNGITDFPYRSTAAIRERMGAAKDLPSFIKVYEQFISVIRTEEDFYEVIMRYLRKVKTQGVLYVEMMFDPQMHTSRGISLSSLFSSLRRAQESASLPPLSIRCSFIMCFLKDHPLESAIEIFDRAFSLVPPPPIIGIGVDNPEHENFPQDFLPLYERASKMGLRLTAHCDVDFEGAHENIRGCLNTLITERIDHGVNVLEDEDLVKQAKEKKVGFTVCPTLFYTPEEGKYKTSYFHRCANGAKQMLDAGLRVTLSSDDPGIMCSKFIGDITS